MDFWSLHLLAACLFPGPAPSIELVLRVEEVGYVSKHLVANADEARLKALTEEAGQRQAPDRELLSTFKLLIRPGEEFSTMARLDKRRVTIEGHCARGHRAGELSLKITVRCEFPSDVLEPTDDGGWREVLDKSSLSTDVAVTIGQTLHLGGVDTSGVSYGIGENQLHWSSHQFHIRVVPR